MTGAPQIYQIRELTDAERSLIKASVPILEQSGELLTSTFYNYMLSNYKDVRPFFNDTNQKNLRQPKILAFSLLNYAKNIDDITPLIAFVGQIVSKHVGLQIKAEHYPVVGSCLLHTMKELLGEKIATEEFLAAWAAAYGNLAQILINAEHEKYEKQQWNGFREFKVTNIVQEAKDVKSVYFTPVDGGSIAIPKRGQYVCFRWTLPNKEETSREYSLSMFPSDNEYRITVRLINGGQVSSYIHNNLEVGSILKVAPPSGYLNYQESKRNMAVFVGGIGITPLYSIIEQGLQEGRQIVMFNSSRSLDSRPFGQWLRDLKEKYGDKFKLKEFITGGEDPCSNPIDEVESRRICENDFSAIDESYDIYLLGPSAYMKFVKDTLAKKGLDASKINAEYFGPQET